MSRLRIAALFALILILAACGGTTGNQGSTPTPASTPTPTPVPPTPTPTIYSVGQSAKVGDLNVTVNAVKTSNGANGTVVITTDPDKQFILVTVTLQNTGSASAKVNSQDFTLKQSDGTVCQNSSTLLSSTLTGTGAPDGTVNAGGKLKGILVFTALKTEKTLSLTFVSGSAQAVWTIKV